MLQHKNDVFSLQEVMLENKHLLPDARGIYFVTIMKGEAKEIILIGSVKSLKEKWKKHFRKIELDFLNRLGFRVCISWVLVPTDVTSKELQETTGFYIKAFQPILNSSLTISITVEHELIKKRIEYWQEQGDDKSTIVNRIWECDVKYKAILEKASRKYDLLMQQS